MKAQARRPPFIQVMFPGIDCKKPMMASHAGFTYWETYYPGQERYEHLFKAIVQEQKQKNRERIYRKYKPFLYLLSLIKLYKKP